MRSRLVPTVLLALLTLATPRAVADECPGGYERYDRNGPLLGCERAVAGSSYREYLVEVLLADPPDRVIDILWKRIRGQRLPGLKRREFLIVEPRRLVFYDQIKTPIVSDRDYTVEVTRQPDVRGHHEIRFQARNELGPPPDPRHTRIPTLHAAWLADPDGAGGTRLAYLTYSEPGGTVPAWMVRRAQARRAIDDVRAILALLPPALR